MTGVSEAARRSEAIDLMPSVRFCVYVLSRRIETRTDAAVRRFKVGPILLQTPLPQFCVLENTANLIKKSVNSRGAFAVVRGSTLETSWLPPTTISHEKNVRTFSGDTRAQSEGVLLPSSHALHMRFLIVFWLMTSSRIIIIVFFFVMGGWLPYGGGDVDKHRSTS